jgi:O-antigen ligase
MIFLNLWVRVTQRVTNLQLDQTVNAPWYVPALFALSGFVVTWLHVELALPLVILAAALDRYRFDLAGAGWRIEHFVFVGVGLAWLARVRPARQSFCFSRADLLLLAYLGVALVASLLYAPIVRESLKFLGLMAYGVVLYWFVRALAANAENFSRGMSALILVGVGASAFGIAAWLVFPFGINLGVQTYSLGTFATFSAYGTLFDSNTLGMFAMAAALVQTTLLLDAAFARWRGALGAGVLIALIAVALSLTRTAWIGLLVGLLLIFLCSPQRRWVLMIGGAALVLLGGALVASSALAGGGGAWANFSLARLLTGTSILFRLDAYARAWNDFLTHPLLGNGVNVFAQKYTSPAGARDWISNLVLMALHDTGIVGTLLLGAWLVWLGAAVWRALRVGRGMPRTFLLALSIAYVALLLCDQATSVFWLGWNWVYVGLLAGGTLVITRWAEQNAS